MAKDVLQNTAQRMSVKPLNKLTLHWQAVDGQAKRIRRHLRPLFVALEFASTDPDSQWLAALTGPKACLPSSSACHNDHSLNARQPHSQTLAALPADLDAAGEPTGLHADRYEFWLYHQVKNVSNLVSSISMTVCNIGISPMSWCPWKSTLRSWHRWISHSCANRLKHSLMPWPPS
jgi:hypothetical protein